jgi:hypothetical protein
LIVYHRNCANHWMSYFVLEYIFSNDIRKSCFFATRRRRHDYQINRQHIDTLPDRYSTILLKTRVLFPGDTSKTTIWLESDKQTTHKRYSTTSWKTRVFVPDSEGFIDQISLSNAFFFFFQRLLIFVCPDIVSQAICHLPITW